MPQPGSIFHNSTLKLVSLLGAVLIWAAIQSDITGGRLWDVFTRGGETERSIVVELHVLKSATDGAPLRLSTNRVSVRIHGEPRRMAALRNDEVRAYIDLTSGFAGPSANVPVRVDVPDGAALGSVSPDTIAVTLLVR